MNVLARSMLVNNRKYANFLQTDAEREQGTYFVGVHESGAQGLFFLY